MSPRARNRPWDLRVEHLDDAFGIDVVVPRLSWKLPRGTARQVAYRCRTPEWDSGRVDSADNVLIPYAGPSLESRARVTWQIKVWTDQGESEWSTPATFEIGLLTRSDWTASWIEPLEESVDPAGSRHAYVFRTGWEHSVTNVPARLYATAHGIYELFLNGTRVADLELTPGFTSYGKRLQVQAYDVGDLLRPGANELRAVVSDGWFRGQVGYTHEHDVFGSRIALLAQLEVGGEPLVCTDDGWKSAPSGTIADLIEGQRTDLRMTDDQLTWTPVRVAAHDFDVLCASSAPPVRRVELVEPRTVTRLAAGRHVVDLGQNINGWLRFENLGPRNTILTATHGEALDASGDVTMEHLTAYHWSTRQALSTGQVDIVESDGETNAFEPRHTTHGFRYARIEGFPGDLAPEDVTGVVVNTDLRRTGSFRSSDARLNRLHDAADWSFRTNACDIPTDCPQRERAGWTGDWQIFAPTAAFLYDVAGFSTKWLRDLAADQRADGGIRNWAPDVAPPGAEDNSVKLYLESSAGWGDAAVLVPWAMWRSYGDQRLLEEQWPSMVAWVDFQTTTASTQRHPSRIERSTTPMPHEQYLWDTGHHWGEWLEPDRSSDDHFANVGADQAIIATAYFAYSATTLAKIAAVLGRTSDAARYDELARAVTNAWRVEFVDDDGNIRSDRQADHVRALAFDLVPQELRARTADRLVELVRGLGNHLNTGFLATPYLLPVLADSGYLDVAYDLLFQDTPPSWLAMIDRGATTIWEDWNGIDEAGRPHESLNHYSKGAVVSFLHEYVAGIRLVDAGPGYRRFRIAPMPGGGLTSAEAVHDSPYGRIESSWTTVGDELRVVARVPPNTVADVELPDGTRRTVTPGTTVLLADWKQP